jgi:fucose permease
MTQFYKDIMNKVYLILLSLVFLVSSGVANAKLPEKPVNAAQTTKSKKPITKKAKKLHKKHQGTKIPDSKKKK